MKISLLIPALNEAGHIETCITSASRAGADQIVVGDGGSLDGTCEIIEALPDVTLVRSKPGRGRQLAAGLAQCDGDMIVMLHADNHLAAGALSQIRTLVAAGQRKSVWGGMRQRIDDDRRVYRWLETGNHWRIRLRGMVFGDQAMFVSRDLLDRIGGIPEVPLMEDVLLSRRLRRHRWPRCLPGPVTIDARRWQQRGVVRQTALNWRIQWSHKLGADEATLADRYR